MAKSARQRLKVFQASMGFFDSVVAAPSRPAALAAWGVRQNLFAEGLARPATDEAAIAAARAHPGAPLRRAIGSKGAYTLDPADLPVIPPGPGPASGVKPGVGKPVGAPQKKPERPRKAPDRRRLDRAEAALQRLDQDRNAEEADFRRRREALDAAEIGALEAYVQARRAAKTKIDDARRAFDPAGGDA